MGLEVDFVDVRNMDSLRGALKPNTKVLFAESVTNPNMRVADVPALRAFSDAHGLTLIIDNTFLSPYLLRPVALGADLVVHSATKYLCGHGDTVAGVIAGKRDVIRVARYKLDSFGQCVSPFNSWLLLRGVRTLPLRMRQHCANGLAVAQFLETHAQVEWVRYPGLPAHPEHDSAARQLERGYGGMLAMKLRGGTAEMNRFANALEMCDLGVSLGDVYTLVYPKPKNGNLLRVSVGCEDIEDILADFDQALARI